MAHPWRLVSKCRFFLQNNCFRIPSSQIEIKWVFSLPRVLIALKWCNLKVKNMNYSSEKLAWWLICWLQTKFKLETIFENIRVFSNRKPMTWLNNIIFFKNCRLTMLNFVRFRCICAGCVWDKKLVLQLGKVLQGIWVPILSQVTLFWILFMLVTLFWVLFMLVTLFWILFMLVLF